jgi:hypothetical protein
MVSHALSRNTVLPTGAATVRRALVRNPQGVVVQHRTFLHAGQFKTVSQVVDTVKRGVLLPGWRIPGGPQRFAPNFRQTTGPSSLPVRPARENQFQQTAATAPVGRIGALIAPLPAFARKGRLYGAPPKP